MKLKNTARRGSAARHFSGVFCFLLALLCLLAFLGGFANGYAAGSQDSGKSHRTIAITPASSEIPQTALKENQDSVYPDTPVLTASLAANEYPVYDALYASVADIASESVFTLPSATTISMERIIEISKIVQNEPELFWVDAMTWIKWKDNDDGTRTYTISITYNANAAQKDDLAQQIHSAALDILNQADCQDILEASAFVNQWIASNVSYVEDKSRQFNDEYSSIVGPLLQRQAVCSGYAKLYCYLMARLGYPSAYCLGYAENGVYHAWNAIKADEAVLYTDSTFNATSRDPAKWLNLPRNEFVGHEEEKKYWYVPTATED